MSKYAEYNALSSAYDGGRLAVCSDLYLGAFQSKLQTPLKDLHVLDAGCGTGNYARMLLDAGVGKVTMFDANEGMLGKATEKVREYIQDGRADVSLNTLPSIPYQDGAFDVVMFNQVLHHLNTGKDKIQSCWKVIMEAKRVLKTGGLVVIQAFLEHQIEKACWFFHLAPRAMEDYKKIYLDVAETCELFTKAGLVGTDIITPLNILNYNEQIYFNGSLDQIRGLDSFWEMATPAEKAEVEEKFQRMAEDGSLKDFITEHDKHRSEVGQLSLIFAKKQ